MKFKLLILFCLLCLVISCASDDEDEQTEISDSDKTEEINDSLPVPDTETAEDAENEQEQSNDEDYSETPDSFCYAGGALLYEGDSQFKLCSGDSGKFQKQLCKNGKWVDEGECVSGSVTIAAGSFKMGCDKDVEGNCPEDAEPVHERDELQLVASGRLHADRGLRLSRHIAERPEPRDIVVQPLRLRTLSDAMRRDVDVEFPLGDVDPDVYDA